MSKKVPAIRDVSPALKVVRDVLLGRSHTLALRFDKDVATRTPELPILPDGPCHKLNTNYYCNRDARREVAPPLEVSSLKQIGEGERKKLPTPGNVYQWD